ncbi:MAG: VWA domain-containing protein, partial [Proteobacteria bacterium]|nr:VWA domain-containing protein [Pseudomonadota bacterium]
GSPVRAALGGRPCDVVFILDASGSMRRFLRFPRLRRFDMARYKVIEIARGLPPGSRVALRVFGSRTGNRQADRARGCRDSILVQPLRPINEPGLLRLLIRTRPSGWTCIGWSLMRAVSDDLKTSRRKCKAIVVISDGDDQCEFMHGRVRDIEARVRARGVTVFQVRIGPAGAVPR